MTKKTTLKEQENNNQQINNVQPESFKPLHQKGNRDIVLVSHSENLEEIEREITVSGDREYLQNEGKNNSETHAKFIYRKMELQKQVQHLEDLKKPVEKDLGEKVLHGNDKVKKLEHDLKGQKQKVSSLKLVVKQLAGSMEELLVNVQINEEERQKEASMRSEELAEKTRAIQSLEDSKRLLERNLEAYEKKTVELKSRITRVEDGNTSSSSGSHSNFSSKNIEDYHALEKNNKQLHSHLIESECKRLELEKNTLKLEEAKRLSEKSLRLNLIESEEAIKALKDDRTESDEKVESKLKENSELIEKVTTLQDSKNSMEEALRSKIEENQELEATFNEKNFRLEEMNSSCHSNFQLKLKEYEAEISDLRQQNSAFKDTKKQSEDQLTKFTKENKFLEKKIANIEQSKQLNEEKKQKENNAVIVTVKKSSEALQLEVKSLQSEKENVLVDNSQLVKEVQTMQKKYVELISESKKVESTLRDKVENLLDGKITADTVFRENSIKSQDKIKYLELKNDEAKLSLEKSVEEMDLFRDELESHKMCTESLRKDIKSLKLVNKITEDDLRSELTASNEKLASMTVTFATQKQTVTTLRQDMKHVLKKLKMQMQGNEKELDCARKSADENDKTAAQHEKNMLCLQKELDESKIKLDRTSERLEKRRCEDIERERMTYKLLEFQIAKLHDERQEMDEKFELLKNESKKKIGEQKIEIMDRQMKLENQKTELAISLSAKNVEDALKGKLAGIEGPLVTFLNEKRMREESLQTEIKTQAIEIENLKNQSSNDTRRSEELMDHKMKLKQTNTAQSDDIASLRQKLTAMEDEQPQIVKASQVYQDEARASHTMLIEKEKHILSAEEKLRAQCSKNDGLLQNIADSNCTSQKLMEHLDGLKLTVSHLKRQELNVQGTYQTTLESLQLDIKKKEADFTVQIKSLKEFYEEKLHSNETTLTDKENMIMQFPSDLNALREKLRQKEEELHQISENLLAQTQTLETKTRSTEKLYADLRNKKKSLKLKREDSKRISKEFNTHTSTLEGIIASKEQKIKQLNTELSSSTDEIRRKDEEAIKMSEDIKAQKYVLQECINSKKEQIEQLNSKLMNTKEEINLNKEQFKNMQHAFNIEKHALQTTIETEEQAIEQQRLEMNMSYNELKNIAETSKKTTEDISAKTRLLEKDCAYKQQKIEQLFTEITVLNGELKSKEDEASKMRCDNRNSIQLKDENIELMSSENEVLQNMSTFKEIEFTNQIKAIKSTLECGNITINSLHSEIALFNQIMEEDAMKIKEQEQEIRTLQDEREELIKTKDILTHNCEELNKNAAKSTATTTEVKLLGDENKKLIAETERHQKKMALLQDKHSKVEKERWSFKERLLKTENDRVLIDNKWRKKLATSNEDITELEFKLKEHKCTINEMQQAASEKIQIIATLKSDLINLNTSIEALKEENQETKQHLRKQASIFESERKDLKFQFKSDLEKVNIQVTVIKTEKDEMTKKINNEKKTLRCNMTSEQNKLSDRLLEQEVMKNKFLQEQEALRQRIKQIESENAEPVEILQNTVQTQSKFILELESEIKELKNSDINFQIKHELELKKLQEMTEASSSQKNGQIQSFLAEINRIKCDNTSTDDKIQCLSKELVSEKEKNALLKQKLGQNTLYIEKKEENLNKKEKCFQVTMDSFNDEILKVSESNVKYEVELKQQLLSFEAASTIKEEQFCNELKNGEECISLLETSIETQKETISRLHQELKSMEAINKTEDRLCSELLECQNTVKSLEAALDSEQHTIVSLNAELKQATRLLKNYAYDSKKHSEINQKAANNSARQNEELNKLTERLNTELSDQIDVNSRQNMEINHLKEKLCRYKASIDDFKAKTNSIISAQKSDVQQLEDDYYGLKNSNEFQKSEISTLQDEVMIARESASESRRCFEDKITSQKCTIIQLKETKSALELSKNYADKIVGSQDCKIKEMKSEMQYMQELHDQQKVNLDKIIASMRYSDNGISNSSNF